VPLITATNVNNGRINLALGEQFVTDETYTLWMRRGFPAVGDVLITTEAPLGEVAAITDARVALAQRIILLKPNPDRVVPGFLRVSLLSSRVQADLLSRASGSTVWGIRADRLRDVMVPLPGPAEQQRVVEIARDAEQASLVTRRLINRQVQLLTERRQALITAAVTGRLDVPVAA
jgi:type I restriction enzyme S subunit